MPPNIDIKKKTTETPPPKPPFRTSPALDSDRLPPPGGPPSEGSDLGAALQKGPAERIGQEPRPVRSGVTARNGLPAGSTLRPVPV